MAKSKKKSKKSKAKRTARKTKEVSKLEKAKKYESDLYVICMENISNISKQTGLSEEDILKFIAKNGIDRIKVMKGFMIAEPIFEIMKRNWEMFGKIKIIREKLEKNTRDLFINELEEEVVKLDQEVAKIEKEKSFYTTLPDKEGMTQLKDKWNFEMNHWKEQLEKSTSIEEYKTAEREIKRLNKIKLDKKIKNASPLISKWVKKISGGIATVQDSIGEMGKPFQTVADDSGFGNKKKGKSQSDDFGFNSNEMFSDAPKSNFGSTAPRKIKSKSPRNDDPLGGFNI